MVYFHSQTKVAAIIKNGTSFSAHWLKFKFWRGDKDLGLNLSNLYIFIPGLIYIYY
jgi:hypothetical protein